MITLYAEPQSHISLCCCPTYLNDHYSWEIGKKHHLEHKYAEINKTWQQWRLRSLGPIFILQCTEICFRKVDSNKDPTHPNQNIMSGPHIMRKWKLLLLAEREGGYRSKKEKKYFQVCKEDAPTSSSTWEKSYLIIFFRFGYNIYKESKL